MPFGGQVGSSRFASFNYPEGLIGFAVREKGRQLRRPFQTKRNGCAEFGTRVVVLRLPPELAVPHAYGPPMKRACSLSLQEGI
jgi:hypothetical protein